MISQAVEGKIAWWNELSAGVGLVLGYILYAIHVLMTPATTVEITNDYPVVEEKLIGEIPADFTKRVMPTRAEIYNHENMRDVYMDSPVFNGDGTPAFKSKTESYSGFGEPVIRVEKIELASPILLDGITYTLQEENEKDKLRKIWVVKYKPRYYLQGMGKYYEKKIVTFPEKTSAESYAVRTATLFAGLSFLLFLLKIRHVFVQQLKTSIFSTRYDMPGDSKNSKNGLAEIPINLQKIPKKDDE